MGKRIFNRRLVNAGALVYAVFLLVVPFEHHDLICHLKTPQHCTACASSVLGSNPEQRVGVGAAALSDAGSAVAVQTTGEGVLLSVRLTGRSPPELA